MVARVREKLVTEGLDAVLTHKKRETPPIAPIFDGERQAQLIALACLEPPAGHARWTIRLLAEHVTKHTSATGRGVQRSRAPREPPCCGACFRRGQTDRTAPAGDINASSA
jgi:Homeodomain-like domain